jgi:hypothetical protein
MCVRYANYALHCMILWLSRLSLAKASKLLNLHDAKFSDWCIIKYSSRKICLRILAGGASFLNFTPYVEQHFPFSPAFSFSQLSPLIPVGSTLKKPNSE